MYGNLAGSGHHIEYLSLLWKINFPLPLVSTSLFKELLNFEVLILNVYILCFNKQKFYVYLIHSSLYLLLT